MTFGSPEMQLRITGKGMTLPMTGEKVEDGSVLQVGGDKGFLLQEIISGNIDEDFVFDIDITSAQRPDFAVIRKQLSEGIALAANLNPVLQQEGKRVNYGELLKDYFATFDTIPNAEKYIEDMPQDEQTALAMQMAQQGGQGVPEEGAVSQGAESVPTGTGGLA